MPVLGVLIKQALRFSQRVKRREQSPFHQQQRVLKKLLRTAEFTAFGMEYHFSAIHPEKNFIRKFQEMVPLFNYNTMFDQWWHRCLKGEENVTWHGRIKYFALSSGTSESASKHIPVTHDMVKSLRKASIRQMLTLSKYDLPSSFFEKGILWLGGSTDLKKHGGYFEGDISGISARKVPIWFQKYYKPGKRISKEKDWDYKLQEITRQANKWDIGIITGVPSWVQLLIEKVIAHYQLKSIHDIWPNLQVYAHGGVSFEPYKKSFEKFFSRPVHYIEMYPASEGFIAFQAEPNVSCMKLILNNGIFFEFVPFNADNFDSNGDMVQHPQALSINEVEEGKDYALLLSTCAGAWRYLIGDVVRFVSKSNAEIAISGRTKHFLSLVGEHLSVDNMNKAVEQVSREFNIEIPEFTVAGISYQGSFAHQWYLGTNDHCDQNQIRQKLDSTLKSLNDDYEVERKSALKDVFVEMIPVEKFYQFMNSKGKLGGQNKFPRVIKNTQLEEWQKFIES